MNDAKTAGVSQASVQASWTDAEIDRALTRYERLGHQPRSAVAMLLRDGLSPQVFEGFLRRGWRPEFGERYSEVSMSLQRPA